MKDFFQKNKGVIRKFRPELYDRLLSGKWHPCGEAWKSHSGIYNLTIDKGDGERVNLHHADDPLKEVPVFLDLVGKDSPGVAILFGMGLGYTPLAILEKRPKLRHIAIVEARPDVFLRAMELNDLTPLLASDKVSIFFPFNWNLADFLGKTANLLKLENIHFLYHIPSYAIEEEFYRSVYDEIFNIANTLNVEGDTFKGFGYLIVDNRFEHLKMLPFQRRIDDIIGMFRDKPAVLIAAGPSLNKSVPLLKEIQNRAVLFAVDSALPTLLRHGITPDFVTSIDFHPVTFEKVAQEIPRMYAQGAPSLICTMWNTPLLFKRCPWKTVFRVAATQAIDIWAKEVLGGGVVCPGAETVAHLNMHAAILAGCSPIVFVGLDLSYSMTASHSEETVLKWSFTLDEDGRDDLLEIKGNIEEKVYTDRAFFSMKQHFEAMIASNPGHYINATAGGAYIEGTEVMPLEEVIQRYCNREVQKDIIKRLIDKNRELDDLLSEAASEQARSLIHAIDAVLKKCRKIEKRLSKSNKKTRTVQKRLDRLQMKTSDFSQLPAQIRSDLQKLERFSMEIDSEKMIWSFVSIMTFNAFFIAERMRYEMEDALKDQGFMAYLRKSLERLLFVNTQRLESVKWLYDRFHDVKEFLEGLGKVDKMSNGERIKFLLDHGFAAMARDLIDSMEHRYASGEISAMDAFLKGKIAALQSMSQEARHFLDMCLERDDGFQGKVEALMEEIVNNYINHARFFAMASKETSMVMLLRGMEFAPEDERLHTAVLELVDMTLQEFLSTEDIHEASSRKAAELAVPIAKNLDRLDFLPTDKCLRILKASLPFLLDTEQYDKADMVTAAMEELMEEADVDVFIAKFKIEMAKGEFKAAIDALRKAVEIDKNMAAYWEEIGDLLFGHGLHAEALHAFEQCFVNLPTKLSALRKIGDCYLAMGNQAGAFEAYRVLQERALSLGLAGGGRGNED